MFLFFDSCLQTSLGVLSYSGRVLVVYSTCAKQWVVACCIVVCLCLFVVVVVLCVLCLLFDCLCCMLLVVYVMFLLCCCFSISWGIELQWEGVGGVQGAQKQVKSKK